MLIEVLYIPGCCNHHPAVERLRRVLSAEALESPISEIPVNGEISVRTLQFPGSPTVRINGIDVDPAPQACFAVSCRLYSDGSGLPSEAILQQAISVAKRQDHGNNHITR